MSRFHKLQVLLGALFATFVASTALAQDYVTTPQNAGSQYVSPPGAGKTTVPLAGWTYTATTGTGAGAHVTLPFTFPYFGSEYARVWVCSQGFIQFGVSSTTGSLSVNNQTWPPSGTEDGMVAALWDDLNLDPGNPFGAGTGSVVHWTAGNAPNRVWYVSWEGVRHFNNPTGNMSFQIQLYETSGRIVLAYAADNGAWGSGATGLSYTAGIDGVNGTAGDGRFYVGGYYIPFWPPNLTLTGSSNLTNHPIRDVQFDPKQYTFTGTLQYDRLVSDATGIGNTVQTGIPLAGLPVELRRADGSLGFRTTLDANGSFSIKATGMDSTKTGSIAVVADTAACVVKGSSSASAVPLSYAFQTNVPFNANLALGTRSVGSAADATGAARSPLNIAFVVQSTADWIASHGVTTAIPKLTAVYATASSSPTSYSYANLSGTVPAVMTIGSTGSPNQDGWDAWIIRREYGRHVLGTLIGSTASTVDTRLDAATSADNAFIEAFGIYLHTAITGDTTLADGINGTTANAFAVESPALVTPKGNTVAGWVAAALYDLVDGKVGESWDLVDGAGTAVNRPLLAAAKMSAPATTDSFLTGWGRAGLDGTDLSRIWIYHKLAPDDANEPNDTAAEALDAGPMYFVKKNLTLGTFNEDWIAFQVTGSPSAVAADVAWDRANIKAQVSVQIYKADGTLLATGIAPTTDGPIHASTNTLVPGTYRLRIRHVGGPAVPSYSVQVYPPISFTTDQGAGWTVNRPFTATLHASGGIPPYTFTVDAPSVLPAGLTFDAANLRITGTPTTAGTGTLQVTLTDSGTPANVFKAGGDFTIHPAFEVKPGPFTPFALGHVHARNIPFVGGTPPVAATLTGALPDGITFDVGTGRFVGTPMTAGVTAFHLDGTDLTGSPGSADSRAVVCVPFGAKGATATLAEGDSACGWFFDAVEGSTVTVSVATAKGFAKRKLLAYAIGPDGAAIPGARAAGGTGKATVTKIKCPRSGRYFVVVSSTSGAEAQLTGIARVLAPTKATKNVLALAPGDLTLIRVPAIANAKVSLRATPDKASKAKLGIFSVTDPEGNQVDLATVVAIKEVGNAVQLDATFLTGGTWTVAVMCLPDKPAKKVTWALKITQPKGVLYDADLGAGE